VCRLPSPRVKFLVKLANLVAGSGCEQCRKGTVDDTLQPGENHRATKTSRNTRMLEVIFTDTARVGEEQSINHFKPLAEISIT